MAEFSKLIRVGMFIFTTEKPPRMVADISTTNMSLFQAEAYANLIVTAANACIGIDEEQPLAVAKSIKDMYEASKPRER